MYRDRALLATAACVVLCARTSPVNAEDVAVTDFDFRDYIWGVWDGYVVNGADAPTAVQLKLNVSAERPRDGSDSEFVHRENAHLIAELHQLGQSSYTLVETWIFRFDEASRSRGDVSAVPTATTGDDAAPSASVGLPSACTFDWRQLPAGFAHSHSRARPAGARTRAAAAADGESVMAPHASHTCHWTAATGAATGAGASKGAGADKDARLTLSIVDEDDVLLRTFVATRRARPSPGGGGWWAQHSQTAMMLGVIALYALLKIYASPLNKAKRRHRDTLPRGGTAEVGSSAAADPASAPTAVVGTEGKKQQ